MNYWKTVAVSALLLPAMALGLQAEEHAMEEVEFLTALTNEQVLVSNLIGSSVHGQVIGEQDEDVGAPTQPGVATGEEVIGTVDDVIVDLDGKVVGIVVGVGGFLGVGERDVGLPWEAIEIRRDPENPEVYIVRTGVDRQWLEDAPELEHDRDGIF